MKYFDELTQVRLQKIVEQRSSKRLLPEALSPAQLPSEVVQGQPSSQHRRCCFIHPYLTEVSNFPVAGIQIEYVVDQLQIEDKSGQIKKKGEIILSIIE